MARPSKRTFLCVEVPVKNLYTGPLPEMSTSSSLRKPRQLRVRALDTGSLPEMSTSSLLRKPRQLRARALNTDSLLEMSASSSPRKPRQPRVRAAYKKAIKPIPALPNVPPFKPLVFKKPLLPAQVTLPAHFIPGAVKIIDLFRLFFSDTILRTIVANTKQYAELKQANVPGKRKWIDPTASELLIFIAICIYSGMFSKSSGGLQWLWNSGDRRRPMHDITEHMSLFRFQQIKRYLHVSSHGQHSGQYYAKLEPLLSHVRDVSKKIY